FIPAELCFGARGTFFARTFDVGLDISVEVMEAAARHKGASVVEILQNCVIFNNGIHANIVDKEVRDDHTIHLKHGEKMLFGKDLDKGLVQDGFNVKAVSLGEDGYTIDDVLVHDAHCENNFLHQQLAMMDGITLPLALGVIRDYQAPTYETEVAKQVEEVKSKKNFASLRDMVLRTADTWEVK
ncbi:MAG: 2-oxoacid:ferredoxin oxidoreductase subunit beta, partial [Muribaculaceae bacterium]|nr:2-oxoacid:ferredoxin oxidoreductase subunit beta [Muribaculaceae bacterium]